MSRLYVNDYINNLQRQISYSVVKIRQKSGTAQSLTKDSSTEEAYSGQSKVDGYAYSLLAEEISWSLQGQMSAPDENSGYASASYQYAGNVLKEPTVLIDFMFKNNREFDFKV